MESIVKADMFFFVTTVCVIIVAAFVVAVLIEVFLVVHRARKITDLVSCEAVDIVRELIKFRKTLAENQFGLKPVFDVIKEKAEKYSEKRPPRKRTTKPKEKEEEL